MNLVYERCAGLDVHKRNVLVCASTPDAQGQRHKQWRTFSTMTADLLRMRNFLKELGITPVAMESTGSFWKPIFNILEGLVGLASCTLGTATVGDPLFQGRIF